MEEMHFIWYMCSILESRLKQVLRYDHGKVHKCPVATYIYDYAFLPFSIYDL